MKCNYKIVLFDLDGTLCESGEGILNSAKYAIREMGFPSLRRRSCANLSGRPWDRACAIFAG